MKPFLFYMSLTYRKGFTIIATAVHKESQKTYLESGLLLGCIQIEYVNTTTNNRGSCYGSIDHPKLSAASIYLTVYIIRPCTWALNWAPNPYVHMFMAGSLALKINVKYLN